MLNTHRPLLESILAERCISTWEDSEINQIQTLNRGNHDWPKETWEKCPIEVTETTTRAQLSLCVCLCVCPHVLYSFLLINTLLISLLFVFVGILFSAKLKGQGLVNTLVQWLGFDTFSIMTQPESPARNQNPASSHCRPRPPEIAANWIPHVS